MFLNFFVKKNFWKNGNFFWFLAMMRDSKNTVEIMIFVPVVWYFCVFCVHVRCAPTCESYSPKHEDIPRYPNLAKISKIRRCSSLRSRVIFLFEEKKVELFKFNFFFSMSHKKLFLASLKYFSGCYESKICC